MKVDISREHTFVVCAYKESQYLEECIQSVLNQNIKSNVIISTGTPNSYIKEVAEKYKLQLFVNPNPSSLASDWNFAMGCAKTELVTLAHQDDVYEKDYCLKLSVVPLLVCRARTKVCINRYGIYIEKYSGL